MGWPVLLCPFPRNWQVVGAIWGFLSMDEPSGREGVRHA